MDFLQKTGSKLVNFCLSGPIYILPPPIGGRHPVPCLGTQISERDMVQQCTKSQWAQLYLMKETMATRVPVGADKKPNGKISFDQ